jgi:hypothetical protein
MRAAFMISIVLFSSSAFAQNQSTDMAGMDMSHMAAKDPAIHEPSEGDGNTAAMHSMEGPPHGYGASHEDDHAA